MKFWTVLIRDQTAHSVQSDLDLQCPQNFLVSSSVRKEFRNFWISTHICFRPFTEYDCGCQNDGHCNKVTGLCECEPPYYGDKCEMFDYCGFYEERHNNTAACTSGGRWCVLNSGFAC